MARPRKLTPLEEIQVYEMKRQGSSILEIAYQFKISVRTVDRIVNKIKKEKEEINSNK